MRGPVAAPVHQKQRLLRVGQRDQQWVVSKGPVVGEVGSLLALAIGWRERSVGVDDRFPEELPRLLLPNPNPAAIDPRHQALDIVARETSTEIPGRGRVRDALGAESGQIDLVLAESLEVLEAVAASEHVERDVQDVIGLVVRQVELQQVQAPIDFIDQADPSRQLQHQADAAGDHPPSPVGHLVGDSNRPHHRARLRTPTARLSQPLRSTLAVLAPLASIGDSRSCRLR